MTQTSTKFSKAVEGLRCAAVSDVGMRRTNNQDALAVALTVDDEVLASRGHLFLVADGMGAHAAGELASQIAADNIPHIYHKQSDLCAADALVGALRDANARIHSKGQNSVDFQGMGTTCSCLALLPTGALIGHVGDSRIYRLRGDVIEQLTFDHSLVWEMALAGQASEEEVPAYVPKNVITRSLGPNSTVQIDLEGPLAVRRGDVFLLCSDGLTGPLSSELLGLVLGALPANDAAQTLVDLANLLGGPDNITVVVVELTDPAGDATDRAGGTNGAALTDSDVGNKGASFSMPALAVTAALAGIGLLLGGAPTWAGVSTLVLALFIWNGWYWHVMRRRAAPDRPPIGASSSQGKAPYRRYEVAPGPQHIEKLGDIVRQLEDLESQRQWHFDWGEIHADRHQAHQAVARSDFRGATVAYCSAVRRLMQAVRDGGPQPSSDSSIHLGED